jgi:hypothetical protein
MFWLLVLACTTTSSAVSAHCALDKPVLVPTEAAPGSTVVATTGPLTTVYDTQVSVGTTAAAVVDVDRSTCDACDACREAAACTSCDACSDCATDCANCVQTVSFVVPDVAPGAAPVTITNIHAVSPTATLTVTPAADTGEDSAEP